MKTKIFYAVIIVLVIGLFMFILFRCDNKPIKVVPDRKATTTDSVVTRKQQKKIDRLDSMLSVRNGQIIIATSNLLKERNRNSDLKHANDTLSVYYRQHRSLQTCDSLVIAKQRYIDGLESEKDSLYMLTHTLTSIIRLERQKTARLDTIITSKETVIAAYSRQMERINCTSEWVIKHRFLAWLFKIKCNK